MSKQKQQTVNIRGEMDATLDGKVFHLRPEFAVIMEIEEKHDALSSIFNRFLEGKASITDLAYIYWCGIKGADPKTKLTPMDVAKLVFKNGVMESAPSAAKFLGGIISAGPASGNGDEAKGTTPTPTTPTQSTEE